MGRAAGKNFGTRDARLLRAAARLTAKGLVKFDGYQLAKELGGSWFNRPSMASLYRDASQLASDQLFADEWHRPSPTALPVRYFRLTPAGAVAAAQLTGVSGGVQTT